MSNERFRIHSAVFLILRKGGEIFLMRRCNTGFSDGLYNIVSGLLDGDETYRTTAAREAMEEAGVKVAEKDMRFTHAMHSKTNREYINLFFKTDEWQDEPRIMEKDKCDDADWYPIDKLPKKIAPHVKQALEKSANGEFYSEYGW